MLDPLIDLFRRAGALPILLFLVLYKFGENLATALTRPFLILKCYAPEDVGLATATVGLAALITGTFIGGAATERFGLTRSLWLFGVIQAVGFLPYILVDQMTPGNPCAGGIVGPVQPLTHRVVMLSAVGVENFCQGMATGAFGVLLLRMTQKQFSATQYALFSSIFAVGRILPGPLAGFTADALGWTPFYLIATAASIPGLLLLQRFAPLGGREPELETLERVDVAPVSRARLVGSSLGVAAGGFLVALAISALLTALEGGPAPSRSRCRLRWRAATHPRAGLGSRLGPSGGTRRDRTGLRRLRGRLSPGAPRIARQRYVGSGRVPARGRPRGPPLRHPVTPCASCAPRRTRGTCPRRGRSR